MSSIQAVKTSKHYDTGTAPSLNFPQYGQTAIGSKNGDVLGTYNNQTPVPIASITKVVTALVVLDEKPLHTGQTGPTITFTESDATLYNKYFAMQGTVARSEAGMQLSQYEIMQAMLVASANNYSDTLVIWAFGSMENYLSAANDYLRTNKLLNTSVADSSGFSPQSKSTASDLVKIGSLALNNTVISEIVSKEQVTINGIGTLRNTNLLIDEDGYLGIKTGTTDEAGSCLLYAAERIIGNEKVTIIGATLGAQNHGILARNAYDLVNQSFASFKEYTVAEKGDKFATYSTEWQGDIDAISDKKVTVLIWPGTEITTSEQLKSIDPTYEGSVGSVTASAKNEQKNIDIMLGKTLSKPSIIWKLTHPLAVFK